MVRVQVFDVVIVDVCGCCEWDFIGVLTDKVNENGYSISVLNGDVLSYFFHFPPSIREEVEAILDGDFDG